MDEAVAELTKRFGPDMQGWKYGQAPQYHHALIEHPLSDVVNAATRAMLSVGPLPRGGDGMTVSATGLGDNQASGGSFKIIADTEDWDNSVGINTPGQSGDPDSPHYRDLFELWAQGRYFPIAYSRKKVGLGSVSFREYAQVVLRVAGDDPADGARGDGVVVGQAGVGDGRLVQ